MSRPQTAWQPTQSDATVTGRADSWPAVRPRLLRLTADASTLGVGLCGLAALAWRQSPEALLLVVAAGVLDVVDGALARRAGGPTDYGRGLDAGSDWLAFGLAPAAISLQVPISPIRLLIAGLFVAAATARLTRGLWRPNPPGGYLGLPIPAAAAALLAAVHLPAGDAGALLTVLALGWLCLSRITYPDLTRFVAGSAGRLAAGTAAVVVLFLGSTSVWSAVALVAGLYVLSPFLWRESRTPA